jgi:hypothetical protein
LLPRAPHNSDSILHEIEKDLFSTSARQLASLGSVSREVRPRAVKNDVGSGGTGTLEPSHYIRTPFPTEFRPPSRQSHAHSYASYPLLAPCPFKSVWIYRFVLSAAVTTHGSRSRRTAVCSTGVALHSFHITYLRPPWNLDPRAVVRHRRRASRAESFSGSSL